MKQARYGFLYSGLTSLWYLCARGTARFEIGISGRLQLTTKPRQLSVSISVEKNKLERILLSLL